MLVDSGSQLLALAAPNKASHTLLPPDLPAAWLGPEGDRWSTSNLIVPTEFESLGEVLLLEEHRREPRPGEVWGRAR